MRASPSQHLRPPPSTTLAREAMEHVRSARRPAVREKRRHEADSFVEKHSADTKHWGAKVRTASKTDLTERAAAMPLLKKMKEDKEKEPHARDSGGPRWRRESEAADRR